MDDTAELARITAAMLGRTAYAMGLECDPYTDQDLLELLANAKRYKSKACRDIVDIWRESWLETQKNITRH